MAIPFALQGDLLILRGRFISLPSRALDRLIQGKFHHVNGVTYDLRVEIDARAFEREVLEPIYGAPIDGCEFLIADEGAKRRYDLIEHHAEPKARDLRVKRVIRPRQILQIQLHRLSNLLFWGSRAVQRAAERLRVHESRCSRNGGEA